MALLLYYVPVSAAFGLFLGSDTIESNPLDIVWSQTYNVFLNTVKLLLAIVFAFFLDSVRTCLILALILFFGAFVLSATYNLRHKHSPCSSYVLWYSRTYVFATATLLTAVCLLYTVTAKLTPSFTIKSISEDSFYGAGGSISWSTFQVSVAPAFTLVPVWLKITVFGFLLQILCIVAAGIPTLGLIFSLWRYRKSSVEHSAGSEALTNAIFSFFTKCKLRCADAPSFSKDDLSRISHESKWAGLVVTILVASCSCLRLSICVFW
jgi:hypothetical protein